MIRRIRIWMLRRRLAEFERNHSRYLGLYITYGLGRYQAEYTRYAAECERLRRQIKRLGG